MAESLFREGKRLMAEKKYAEACPKLAESQRLDPAGGTLLTLAVCHEAEGRIATAWAEFNEALSVAERDRRPDRERIARARIDELEPRLSRLTIQLPASVRALAGLEILQDGVALGPAAWGVASPVDPGVHAIEVRAPGKKAWSTTIQVATEGAALSVEVPELESTPIEAPPPPPVKPLAKPRPAPRATPVSVDTGAPSDGLRTAGWVSLGLGGAGVVLGTFFGVRALSQSDEASRRCPQAQCEDPEAIRLNDEAGRSADVATVSFAIAGAALVFATYALLIHEPAKPMARRPNAVISW